jgi:Pretoxin HINT domain
VLATDPATGKTSARTVTAAMSHDDNDLLDLTIKDDAGHEGVLKTTDHHKIWSVTAGAWVLAKSLHNGDQLREPDGTTASVVKLTQRPGHQNMLDLTVDQLHDFYVLAGDTSVLVHNAGGMDGCSDAAYQGVLHIREEIAAEGPGGTHGWAANMSDNALADYLDGFSTGHAGQALEKGGVGWYDPERGVAIFQRSEHSMTAYFMSYEDFLAKLG